MGADVGYTGTNERARGMGASAGKRGSNAHAFFFVARTNTLALMRLRHVMPLSALSLLPRVGGDGRAIDRARAAYMATALDTAAHAYHEVIATDTTSADRVEAFTTLANIAWRIHRDTITAARLLDTSVTVAGGQVASLQERARMLTEFGQYAEAERIAREAVSVTGSAADSLLALETLATTLFQHASDARSGRRPSPDSLAAVVVRLKDVVRRSPGSMDPARLLVRGGALTRDGDAILEGWRSYYLIDTGDSLRGPLASPRHTLETNLAGHRGSFGNARAAATAVALAGSGFIDEAALLARDRQTRALDARLPAIIIYHDFVDTIVQTTNEYYRQIALGHGDSAAWQRDVERQERALWSRVTGHTAPGSASMDSVASWLDHRFGAMVNIGNTAGQLDLHMGHRVVDDHHTVRQYGHEATVRLVVLDGMVSNGYQTWVWDGRASHGGWGTENLIVQIRAGYVAQPIFFWHRMTEPSNFASLAQRIVTDSTADATNAADHPTAYFASIPERMRRDGLQALLDSLTRSGDSGPALESAFEREYGRDLVESSIFAHEGRHAIDHALHLDLTPADLEFRGKLSEVAFAPRPRLALDAIVSPNIGDASPHGQANARIMQGLLAWMTAHASEIAHLDPRAPMLMQLPLLTDDQLRRAFASMDPMATR